jgi:Secretion system C-terminal sorting domain
LGTIYASKFGTCTSKTAPQGAKKSIIMKQITLTPILLVLFGTLLSAQATDPTPFDLTSGSFSLTSYTGTSYPANMAIGFESSNTPGTFTNDLTSNLTGNGSNGGEWNDEGANGISMQGANNQERMSLLLALNTTGRSSIAIAWTVSDINVNNNVNFIELQYRVGASGAFTNVINDLYQQGTNPSGTSFSIALPVDANDQPIVHVRWIYYESGSGSRDRLAVDDIAVTSSPLPITLTKFDTKAIGRQILVSFTTATESNNSHFDIERSADGTRFEVIGQVAGAGNSLTTQNYTFEDLSPLSGVNYYRLRQVDFDGRTWVSPIRSASTGRGGAVTVVPSPAIERVQINMETAPLNDAQWQIFDMTGRVVLAGTWPAKAQNIDVEVGLLVEGIYAFRLTDGMANTVKQFRKR